MIGALQGYWIAYFGIPAFIVTLAGMLVFRAVTLTVLGNQGIGPFPDAVRTLSNGFVEGYLGNVGLGPLGGADTDHACWSGWRRWRRSRSRSGAPARPGWATGRPSTRSRCSWRRSSAPSLVLMFVIVQLARFKNLPWVLVLLAALVIGYTLLTNRAVFGRHIYAVGGNLQAAALSGVKVKSISFWIFVNMGVLAAHRRASSSPGRLNQAGPTAGTQLRARRHRGGVHRRRRGAGRGGQGRRRDHRRPDHGA